VRLRLVCLLVRDPGGAAPPDREDTSIRAGLRHVWRNGRLHQLLLGLGIVEIGWTAMIPVLALHDGFSHCSSPRIAGLRVG
jgi:hypothetical protein